ncbi:2-C-methyl-D-erythritol 4-phosphate cytidylyltransferase [Ferrimonas gelatinilytica]|uniref:2-C-methyl-D-erythritol 4-phosphate cytidylyltransferase n=1 Tax=Ferrimonas gelatinilytica TaxID=1255257 RepID=A0ABP9S7J4_9GAMM
MSLDPNLPVIAVVPAAGVGKRMGEALPKQYLPLKGRPILSHTLSRLLQHPAITRVVVALGPEDGYFDDLPESRHPKLTRVIGGSERADSVLRALETIEEEGAWALVHDAARPCLSDEDIALLLHQCGDQGALLAAPVRDTMKRADAHGRVDHTVERAALWHALTPQLFPAQALRDALRQAKASGAEITDESSAMERLGWKPILVPGRVDNIKVTHPDDLRLAALFLA